MLSLRRVLHRAFFPPSAILHTDKSFDYDKKVKIDKQGGLSKLLGWKISEQVKNSHYLVLGTEEC